MTRFDTVRMVLPFCWLISSAAQAEIAPADSLDDAWIRVCTNAEPGTTFADRCAEILDAGPGSGDRRSSAAIGNNLELNSAQHRIAAAQQSVTKTVIEEREEESKLWQSERLGIGAAIKTGELERDDDDFESGFKSDLKGFHLMADYRLNRDLVVGVLIQTQTADTEYDGNAGELDTDFTNLTVFTNLQLTPEMWLDAYLGRGQLEFDIVRNISYSMQTGVEINGVATADTEGDQLSLGASIGHLWLQAGNEYALKFGLDYLDFETDAYQEQDNVGLALAYDSETYNSLTATLGAVGSWPISMVSGVLVPQLSLDLQYESKDEATDTTTAFVGDTQGEKIIVTTADPDRTSVNLGAGVQWVLPSAVSLYAEYQQRFAHDFLEEWSITVGIRAGM